MTLSKTEWWATRGKGEMNSKGFDQMDDGYSSNEIFCTTNGMLSKGAKQLMIKQDLKKIVKWT